MNAQTISLVEETNQASNYLQQCYEIHLSAQPYPWSYKVFCDHVSEPYCILAILQDAKVAAYVVTLTVAGEITIMDIAVDNLHRRHGLAKQLLLEVIARAGQYKATGIILEVRESNTAAQSLYRKLGFQSIAERKNYYPGVENPTQKENAILMQRAIDPIKE